ncbi:MAG: putative terminase small subunit [Prokaryotic dsDNA virus sp.]|nr:MAG: putative terminase small subunit [Prokaryotic dsDNA virus sp.]|tara:strand:- start:24511 stop:25059 length:549 start_codon:yes stop_codon:yes gene_type:complete
MAEELVTSKRVAEHLDITQEYVSKLKSQGILPGGRGRQKMNLRDSRLAYINFLRTRARLSPKGTDTSISEEKTRLTKAQADKAEMEVEVITRGMLKAQEVKEGWIAFVSNVRAKLLNLPSKVAHQVVGLETYAQVEGLINEEIYEVLNELASSELPESLRSSMEQNSESVSTTEETKSIELG